MKEQEEDEGKSLEAHEELIRNWLGTLFSNGSYLLFKLSSLTERLHMLSTFFFASTHVIWIQRLGLFGYAVCINWITLVIIVSVSLWLTMQC